MEKDTGNPHLKRLNKVDLEKLIFSVINRYKKEKNVEKVTLLDIGGGRGWGKKLYERSDIEYFALDLNDQRNIKNICYVKGDITDVNLSLSQQFDIIFTKDTFEHILNPWDSTANILKYLKNDGYFIFLAPFSWRYHASPYDCYRYSHTGSQYLFERLGGMKKITSGYIYFGDINGLWKNKKDMTLDGKAFPKCIEVFYIGQRNKNHKFDLNDLDADFCNDHSI